MIKVWFKNMWTSTSNEGQSSIDNSLSNKAMESAVIEDMETYLINQETIDQIIKDTSVEVFPMLADNFLREAELRTANIVNAIDNADFDTLEFEAHTLGSTALAMGATGLGLMARKMEMACLNGSPQETVKHRAELETLAEQSKAAFASLLVRIQND